MERLWCERNGLSRTANSVRDRLFFQRVLRWGLTPVDVVRTLSSNFGFRVAAAARVQAVAESRTLGTPATISNLHYLLIQFVDLGLT